MACTAQGTSYYDCDFEVQSGRSANDKECTIHSHTSDVKHIVKVIPVRQKYHKMRVTGRINADSNTANAKFKGSTVLPNGMEWQETKNVTTVSIIFDSAKIGFINHGNQDIETKIEEQSRWSGNYNQIDQNDLTIVVDLK